ncbi:porin [Rhodopseudomonas sp. P2A-2r]|uniref:porin n=1 Tax=Rhodopseudomonas sp. P2A-2r TaxID=2991972 RepID=UPI0022347DD2|nr:porin [Rhodopseudomonas sp. P2A-2r]UZE51800.1 porin [Rhodopseudomonas sp. P2A-2r]
MNTIKSLILGSAAGLLAMGGAQAADLPMKAKAVEYVKICSLYGAGFYYIPGTDTCIKLGGAIRLETTLNGQASGNGNWYGGANGSQSFNQDWYGTRARFNLNVDTRTATEYGVLRTYGDMKVDFTRGTSSIAGGTIAEVDYAFIQFAGFTMGKSVSMFDPQWALSKPTISSGFQAGSNNATGISQFAYTASFGNGVSATISLEDAQPYRTAGVVNTSSAFVAPFGGSTLTGGAYGINNFLGNASTGDHVPDVVGNLRLDQAWGSAFVSAAAHEVHGTYYTNADSGRPSSTYGYAVSGGFELKNLPTGAGDSFKLEATYAKGAAKYVWGGTQDSSGAGRYARASGNGAGSSMAFGYVLDGVYSNGTGIDLSTAWDISAYYEHYWNPNWRTSLYGNYSTISYGSAGNAALMQALTNGSTANITGVGSLAATGGDMKFSSYQVGTKTAWTPVKNLTLSADFLYTRLDTNLTGTYNAAAGQVSSSSARAYTLGDQNVYQLQLQAQRSF